MFDHPVISAQWKHSTCAHWCEKEFELSMRTVGILKIKLYLHAQHCYHDLVPRPPGFGFVICCLHAFHLVVSTTNSNSSTSAVTFEFTQSTYVATILENTRRKVYVQPTSKMGIYLSPDLKGHVRYRIISGDAEGFFKAESVVVGNFAYLRVHTKSLLDLSLNPGRPSQCARDQAGNVGSAVDQSDRRERSGTDISAGSLFGRGRRTVGTVFSCGQGSRDRRRRGSQRRGLLLFERGEQFFRRPSRYWRAEQRPSVAFARRTQCSADGGRRGPGGEAFCRPGSGIPTQRRPRHITVRPAAAMEPCQLSCQRSLPDCDVVQIKPAPS
ncbi:protocadherin Fat 3, partial [Trichinella spiralis]|uniref:protocadherin Fat 3 n=1 Tax=Trichinella spiralis TaxID=6334 RepID=UPI0001EFD236